MFHMSYGQIIIIAWANIWHKTTNVHKLSNILILNFSETYLLLIKDRNNVNSSLIKKILIKIERNMKINFCEKINNNNGNMLIFGHLSIR